MQNAKNRFDYEYSHIDLPDAFPAQLLPRFVKTDEVVTTLHIHNLFEIGICRSGMGTFFVAEKVMSYNEGDMVVVANPDYHRSQSIKGIQSEWSWVFCDPVRILFPRYAECFKFRPGLFAAGNFGNVIRKEQCVVERQLFEQIMAELQQRGPHWQDIVSALLFSLFARLQRRNGSVVVDDPDEFSEKPSLFEQISPALAHISNNYQQPIKIPRLAAFCHMSLRSFQLAFVRCLACSARDYIQRCRVNAAESLLLGTDQRVTDIAFQCGFNTLSCFNRAFKKLKGISPRDIRR